MERRTRLYNTRTRKWEWWYVETPSRMPWEGLWTRLRWLARHLKGILKAYCRYRWGAARVWDFNPETMAMTDRREERRTRRRERLRKVTDAVLSMLDMQRYV